MNKVNVIKIIEILKESYPDAKCSLNFKTPFEMAVAVILSAQCTDERVNKITPKLFDLANTPEKINKLPQSDLEKLIYSTGFYRNKAKNIKSLSKKLLEDYNGKLPQDINELVKLPGVGRKSANVIMLEAFNKPVGIAVDTHVKRISNRIGLSKEENPTKVEKDLLKIIPKEYYKVVNHVFIYHGRKTCKSQNPKCNSCPIKDYCEKNINIK